MAKGRFVPDDEEQPVEIRTGFTPARPTMPLPAAETDRERRDESFDPTTAETPNPQHGDPSGDTPRESRPQTDRDTQEGFFPEVHSSGITGHFDAWLGEVMQTYYVTGHSSGSDFGLISVRRSDVDWDASSNYPTGFEVNATLSQRTPGIVDAKPFPLRNDQQKYVVSIGDFVLVVTGRDNRHWYMVDELPFVGMVIDNTQEGDGAETDEDFSGGAGNKSLCVRLQKMTGDPDGANWLGPGFADADGAGDANIDFTGVKPIGPTNVTHGYRVGDFVMVQRRGRYLFCTSTRQGFFAQIVTTGPGGEGEPADERYYVKEVDWTIAYSASSAAYTFSEAFRTAAVGGQSGTSGRWVLASNRSLRDTGHELTTVAADGGAGAVYVWVNMIADPVTSEVGYSFYYQPAIGYPSSNDLIEFGKPVTGFDTGATILLDPCTAAGVDNGKANVTVYLAAERSTIEIPYAVTRIFSFHRFTTPFGAVDGVLIGFPAGSHASPSDYFTTPEGSETEDAEIWDRSNQAGTGVVVPITSRIVYDHTSLKTLFGFYRDFTFDATGLLADISREHRYTIDTPDDCP